MILQHIHVDSLLYHNIVFNLTSTGGGKFLLYWLMALIFYSRSGSQKSCTRSSLRGFKFQNFSGRDTTHHCACTHLAIAF